MGSFPDGFLTIYTSYPGGNLVHERETINLARWEND